MKRLILSLLTPLFLLSAHPAMSDCPTVLNHRLNTLNGEPIDLCTFSGKVLLIANTASYCGNTPQYRGLQALYEQYRDRGLVVIGFPANDFGSQEPGSNEEIRDFCELTYGVEFPMVEKTSVAAGKANPVFTELARMTKQVPEWNFHKYLVSRDGSRAFSYPARMQPQNEEIVSRIEALLAE
jgi:glutathione peroxidase